MWQPDRAMGLLKYSEMTQTLLSERDNPKKALYVGSLCS